MFALAAACLLAGCTAPPHASSSSEKPGGLDPALAPHPQGPSLKEWSVVGHANGTAGLRVRVWSEQGTNCRMVFAAHVDDAGDMEAGLNIETDQGGEPYEVWGGDSSGTFFGHEVRTGGIDTRPATDAVYKVIDSPPIYQSNRTDWLQDDAFPIAAGWTNITLTAKWVSQETTPAEAMGGSMLIAGVCKQPLVIGRMAESPDAVWWKGEDMPGATAVVVDPHALQIYQGTASHTVLYNESQIIVIHNGAGQGHVTIDGPAKKTLDWAPNTNMNSYLLWQARGAAGTFNLTWDIVNAGGIFSVEMRSWTPLPPQSLVATAKLPVP
jgi:hypothetical protein